MTNCDEFGLPRVTVDAPMPNVQPPKKEPLNKFVEERSKEPYDMSSGLYVDAGGLDKKLLEKELNEKLNLPEEKSK